MNLSLVSQSNVFERLRPTDTAPEADDVHPEGIASSSDQAAFFLKSFEKSSEESGFLAQESFPRRSRFCQIRVLRRRPIVCKIKLCVAGDRSKFIFYDFII
eukprot:GEMP01123224.1.p1 GENE.GEMP01123224.1~~GEMP01123224.1.p1  ORF type:complete len:101 (-),score=3.03 GEMP01123224.1:147-449(-)